MGYEQGTRQMNCGEAKELFEAQLAGLLEPAEHARLDRHRAACLRCRREFAWLSRIDQALDSLTVETAPADLASSVTARLARARAMERAARVVGVLATAASVVFYVVGPGLEKAAGVAGERLDRAASSLAETLGNLATAISGREAALMERSPEFSGGAYFVVAFAGVIAILLVLGGFKLWQALALEWHLDVNGAEG